LRTATMMHGKMRG
ncbi:hypothetical protein D031_4713B, partial [Vibrio parahaemolyticus VP-48]